MCPVVLAYRIEVHVKKGRELLLNARNWSLSLVSMVINDISVGREKDTTCISIPLGVLTIDISPFYFWLR